MRDAPTTAKAGPVQLVVGTIRYSDGTAGTSYAVRASSADDLVSLGLKGMDVTLTGPPGWNGGNALTTNCAQDSKEATTLCDNWGDVAPVAGSYTLTASGGSWSAQMANTSTAAPPAITGAGYFNSQEAVWWSTSATGSAYVSIYDSTNNDVAWGLVSATSGEGIGSVTLSPGNYGANVVIYPSNMMADQPLNSVYNLSVASRSFVVPAATSGPQAQFVVGAFHYPNGTLGTNLAVHVPSSNDYSNFGLDGSLTVHGPAGWNGGAALTVSCHQPPGIDPTNCIHWYDVAPVPGTYTLSSSAGTWTAQLTDTSTVTSATITSASASTSTVTVAWTTQARSSLYLSLERGSTVLAVQILDAGTTSYTFTGLSLSPGTAYNVYVLTEPNDLTSSDLLNPTFNVASAGRTVVVPSTKKSATTAKTPTRKKQQIPRITAQVHGSGSGGGGIWIIGTLYVQGVPAGGVVRFHCVSGCSIDASATGSGSVYLRTLKGAKIPARAVATITVTKPGWIGFSDRLTFLTQISALGHFFTETKRCLAPNSTTRTVSCTK